MARGRKTARRKRIAREETAEEETIKEEMTALSTEEEIVETLKEDIFKRMNEIGHNVDRNNFEKKINEIEDHLRKRGRKEIKSSTVGELVMKKMKKLDNVAYIRFASVYRDCQDIKDFKKELRGL